MLGFLLIARRLLWSLKAINVLKKLTNQPMTEEQAEQLEKMNQSQCNDVGYEWEFEEVPLSEVLL